MRVQLRQGIHGVREPVLARLSDRCAAKWQGHRGRRLHALRRGVIGGATLAKLLGATYRAAAATLELACGDKEFMQTCPVMP